MVLAAFDLRNLLPTEQGRGSGKPPVHVPTSLFRTDDSPPRQVFDVNQTDHVSSFDPNMMEINVLSAFPLAFFSSFQLPLMPPSPFLCPSH